MTRRRSPARTTWYYDRQGRLRARAGPEGVTRWEWDGVRLVGVTSPNRPNAVIPTPPNADPRSIP